MKDVRQDIIHHHLNLAQHSGRDAEIELRWRRVRKVAEDQDADAACGNHARRRDQLLVLHTPVR
jgi:hypothetical protein